MYVNALKVLKKLSYSTWSRSGKFLQLLHSSIFQYSLKFCFLQHFNTLEKVNFSWDNRICKLAYDICLKDGSHWPWQSYMVIIPQEKHTQWSSGEFPLLAKSQDMAKPPYNQGNAVTRGSKPDTQTLRQDGPLVTISMLTRASVLWVFE